MLKAGVAKTDITPDPGSIMACFPRKRTDIDSGEPRSVPGKPDRVPRRPDSAHDPLKARALVMEGESETVAFCVADVPHFDSVDVARIREKVAARVPRLSPDKIILAGTHTHSGPDTLYLFGNEPDDPGVDERNSAVADAIVSASMELHDVTPYFGRIRLEGLTHNRRVKDADGHARMAREYEPGITTGPTDPELTVLRLDTAAGTKAVLFNFAAHALTLGPENNQFSADYPGTACRQVEATLSGALALFANGAAGDVHPRHCMRADFRIMEAMGERLAEGVLKAVAAAKRLDSTALAHGSRVLEFTHVKDPSFPVKPEIHAVRLGPVVIGVVPGEFFVEFQLHFKEKLRPAPAMLIGYSGAWTGYVAPEYEYGNGGYGVSTNGTDPLHRSRTSLPPGAGEKIIAQLIKVVHALRL